MNYIEDYKAFIDHELSPAEAARVEAEIESSEESQREVEFIKLLGFELRDAAVQPTVTGLDETLAALAETAPRRGPTFLQRYGRILGAAAACLLLAGVAPKLIRSANRSAGASEVGVESAKAFAGGEVGRVRNQAGAFADQDYAPSSGKDAVLKGRAADEEPPTATSNGSPSSSLPAPSVPSPTFDRPLMIRHGELSLLVKDIVRAQDDAVKIVTGLGGMEQNTGSSRIQGALGTATMTLRVPESRFSEAMRKLKELGEFQSENKTGEDVTAQVADVEARLKVMRAEEEQYVTLLRATRKIGEILEVKERLSQVRQEIESLAAQSKALRRQASYSTIDLTLSEKPALDRPAPPENWSDDTWTSAKKMLAEIGRFLAQSGIYLLVLSPIWLPVAAWFWWHARKRRP